MQTFDFNFYTPTITNINNSSSTQHPQTTPNGRDIPMQRWMNNGKKRLISGNTTAVPFGLLRHSSNPVTPNGMVTTSVIPFCQREHLQRSFGTDEEGQKKNEVGTGNLPRLLRDEISQDSDGFAYISPGNNVYIYIYNNIVLYYEAISDLKSFKTVRVCDIAR